jgi:Txe/YoeB family toxin of Txe-Axe toxin-antitoxin module
MQINNKGENMPNSTTKPYRASVNQSEDGRFTFSIFNPNNTLVATSSRTWSRRVDAKRIASTLVGEQNVEVL